MKISDILGFKHNGLEATEVKLNGAIVWSKEQKHTDNPIPTSWTYAGSGWSTDYAVATNGNYKITASSYYSSSYGLSYAFDNDIDTWWRSESTRGDKWVKLELPEAIKVTKFNLSTSSNTTLQNIIVTIQGSNDNSNWDNIGTYTETTALTEVELTSPDYYKYYRLWFETQSSKYVAGVYEWQISEYYTKG